MIPPNLLAELRKQAVIEYYKDGSEKPNSFLLGAEVLWSRLCELSEDDHSENDLLKAFGQLEDERYQLTDFYGGELCYFTEGWKRAAALFQAALLKAREELTAKDLLISQMRMQLSMTNSSWPHENKLHEELSAERDRAAENLRVAREEIAGLKHASVTVAVELTEAWNKERARAEKFEYLYKEATGRLGE